MPAKMDRMGVCGSIERWRSAQGRSSLKEGKRKETCRVTSVVWQATYILDIPVGNYKVSVSRKVVSRNGTHPQ